MEFKNVAPEENGTQSALHIQETEAGVVAQDVTAQSADGTLKSVGFMTAWKVSETATKSKLEADNAKQCYLEIACKIRQSGAYLLGSASEYKTIYVPFGDTWEQGKRHIYTLIFGGGYDDQGEAVLNPIQFDAETTGWVDADKDVNVQP